MPAPSIWGLHIDGLRQKYPGKTQIMQTLTDDEILIQQQQQQNNNSTIVVQRLLLAHPSGWDLLIQLTQGFPDEAPIITFSGYRPPYRWSPGGQTADTAGNGTLLHEAVDHAVNALTKLSGNIGPVSVTQIAAAIAQQQNCSAAVEADALKAFIDQTTFGIACQRELDGVWDLIEATCRSNLEMQPQIQQVQVDVAQLQHRVRAGLAGLGARRKDVLDVMPLGTTDGLLRAAREELKELEDAAAQACKALGSVSASKNLVENFLKKKRRLLNSNNSKNNNNNNNNMRQQHRGTTVAQNQSQQQQQNYQISFGNNNNNNNNSPSTVNNNNNNNAAMMNDMDSILGSGNINSAPRQAADIADDENNNNTNQNDQTSPSSNNNNSTDAQIFFVPTMPPPSTTQQQQQGSASVQSVFNSVLQAPLTFNLDNSNTNNNNNNQNYYGNNNHEQIHDGDFSDDNNKDDNSHEIDEDDDDDDVMDKAVEYSMKACIEARRAAMLLRRFSAQ